MVCVHGLSRNSRDFDYLARDLAHSCRVVCPDVVGRGDSEWLADKSDYSFSTYLSDAAALIARITAPAPPVHMGVLRGTLGGSRKSADGPAQIDWLGTSMGGLIGMLLAAKRGSPIRRLVLNDVGAFISWGSLYRLKGYVAGGGAFKSAAEVEAYLCGAESDVLSRDTLERMRALRPDTEVLELPGIGHAPALMSYDQIAAVREFLLR